MLNKQKQNISNFTSFPKVKIFNFLIKNHKSLVCAESQKLLGGFSRNFKCKYI